jgi:hypothetical protein
MGGDVGSNLLGTQLLADLGRINFYVIALVEMHPGKLAIRSMLVFPELEMPLSKIMVEG